MTDNQMKPPKITKRSNRFHNLKIINKHSSLGTPLINDFEVFRPRRLANLHPQTSGMTNVQALEHLRSLQIRPSCTVDPFLSKRKSTLSLEKAEEEAKLLSLQISLRKNSSSSLVISEPSLLPDYHCRNDESWDLAMAWVYGQKARSHIPSPPEVQKTIPPSKIKSRTSYLNSLWASVPKQWRYDKSRTLAHFKKFNKKVTLSQLIDFMRVQKKNDMRSEKLYKSEEISKSCGYKEARRIKKFIRKNPIQPQAKLSYLLNITDDIFLRQGVYTRFIETLPSVTRLYMSSDADLAERIRTLFLTNYALNQMGSSLFSISNLLTKLYESVLELLSSTFSIKREFIQIILPFKDFRTFFLFLNSPNKYALALNYSTLEETLIYALFIAPVLDDSIVWFLKQFHSFSDITPQSDDPLRDTSSSLPKRIISFLALTFLKLKGFGIPVVSEILGVLGNFLNNCSDSLDIMTIGSRLFTSVQEAFTTYTETGCWSDLFPSPPGQVMIDKLDAMKEVLMENKSIHDLPKLHAQLVEARRLVVDAGRFKDTFLSSKRKLLDETIQLVTKRLSTNRIKPFGLILVGPMGLGKTYFTKLLEQQLKRKFEIEDDISLVMNYKPEAKFQMVNAANVILCVNDAFQTKEEYLDSPMLALLQQFVDTDPYRVEAASLAEKENSTIEPSYILISTNETKYCLSQAVGNIDKLDRRYFSAKFIYTEALAKALKVKIEDIVPARAVEFLESVEYAPGYVQIVFGKIDNSCSKNNDFFTEPRLGPTGKGVPIVLDAVQDLVNLVILLKQKEDDRIKNVRDNTPPPCVKCGMPGSAYCACNFEEILKPRTNTIRIVPRGFPIAEQSLIQYSDFLCALLVAVAFERLFHYSKTLFIYMTNLLESFQLLITESNRLVKNVNLKIDKLDDLRDILLKNKTKILGFLAGTSVLFFIWKQYSDQKMEDQAMVNHVINVDSTSPTPVRPTVGGAINWSGDKIMKRGGHFKIRRSAGLATAITLNMVQVASGLFVTNYHFFRINGKVDPNVEVTISDTAGQKLSTHKLTPRMCFFLEHRDLAFLAIEGLTTQPSKDNLLYNSPVGSPSGWLGEKYEFGSIKYSAYQQIYVYEANTQDGDCGLPLIDSNGQWLGIHRGKNAMGAVAAAIFRSDIVNARKYFTELYHIVDQQAEEPSEEVMAQFPGKGLHPNSDIYKLYKFENVDLTIAGHLPLGHSNFRDTAKSTVAKTRMFGTFGKLLPPMGAPYLGKGFEYNGVYVSPSLYRIRAMEMGSHTWIDHPKAELAVESILSDLTPVPLQPLSLHQAICGDPMNGYMNPTDTSKAVGYELGLLGVTKKNAYISTGVDNEFEVHPVLLDRINKIKAIAEGNDPLILNVMRATIKDEVYPLEKTIKGKARYFYVGDQAFNIVSRQYLLPILALLIENPFSSSCFVAVNAGSPTWGRMHDYLNTWPDRCCDMDQASYDLKHGLLNPYVVIIFCKFAKSCGYSDKDIHTIRRLLQMSLHYALIMEGNLYKCDKGWCSGLSLTIIWNCIIGKLLVYYSHYVLYKGPPVVLRDWYHMCLTGDDNSMNIHPSSPLTGSLIAAVSWLCGYEVTSGDKVSEILFKPITEMPYLQRHFIESTLCGQRVVFAPLNKKSIYKSLAYVVALGKDMADIRDNGAACCALREMFMHSESDFNTLYMQLSEYPFLDMEKMPTYTQLVDEYLSGTYTTWDPRVTSPPILIELDGVYSDQALREYHPLVKDFLTVCCLGSVMLITTLIQFDLMDFWVGFRLQMQLVCAVTFSFSWLIAVYRSFWGIPRAQYLNGLIVQEVWWLIHAILFIIVVNWHNGGDYSSLCNVTFADSIFTTITIMSFVLFDDQTAVNGMIAYLLWVDSLFVGLIMCWLVIICKTGNSTNWRLFLIIYQMSLRFGCYYPEQASGMAYLMHIRSSNSSVGEYAKRM